MTKQFVGVLAGGAGTRLWPLSRQTLPKQFHSFGSDPKPMIVKTIERLSDENRRIVVLSNSQLIAPLKGVCHRWGVSMESVAEPCIRSTGPAVALLTHMALMDDPESVVGAFPSDHFIKKDDEFRNIVNTAMDFAAQGNICTLGIRASYPATSYGYIELEKHVEEKSFQRVVRFVEKPRREIAVSFLASQKFLWNAGIFIFSARAMKEAFETYAPDIWDVVKEIKKDLSNLQEVFPKTNEISVDYALMEKLDNLYCLPADVGWSDLGSWEEVSEEHGKNEKQLSHKSSNCHYHAFNQLQPEKTAAFLGVENITVVDTPDAILVAKKGQGQEVKKLLEKVKKAQPEKTEGHTFEERPWGKFQVLLDTDYFKSKLIQVWPGQRLSLQSHTQRAEHWVIVKGQAEVTLNDEVYRLQPGEHIHIPLGVKHRMSNPGNEIVEFIEVQTGSYFGEDDITRYDDEYGRK